MDEDAINLQTQYSPGLLPKFRSLDITKFLEETRKRGNRGPHFAIFARAMAALQSFFLGPCHPPPQRQKEADGRGRTRLGRRAQSGGFCIVRSCIVKGERGGEREREKERERERERERDCIPCMPCLGPSKYDVHKIMWRGQEVPQNYGQTVWTQTGMEKAKNFADVIYGRFPIAPSF